MNRNLVFVSLSLFTWGFGEGLFFNFQPIYLKQLGSSEAQIGLILGAFGAAMAITHIPAGRLADRFGRKPLLVIAWVTGLVSTVMMALARGLPFFVVGMLGYGLTAFVSSPLGSYVTAARGKLSVGAALSMNTATFSMGMVLGPLTGGWIGDHYGLRTVYFIAAGVFVLSTLFIMQIQKQPLDRHDPDSPPVNLLNNSRLKQFLAVVAFAMFAMYIAQPLTPNFLEDVRALSLSNIGVVFALGALGNSLFALTLSRFEPHRGFVVAQMMVALFALLIWRGTNMPTLAFGYFLLGGFRASRPLAMAQARSLVHQSQMGLTYGVMETANAVIFILTPPLAGLIYERDSFLIYQLAIALIAISIIVSAIVPRRLLHA
ncbi:MAG: MFS transporter [Anaerolineales bacterium]|nr:MAG: MFS transporter [Anaerolineales bacterium]